MAQIAIQGIVSTLDDLPFVQFRQLDDNGNEEFHFQMTPAETRDFAQKAVEASMNAVYDAALIAWSKEVAPENPEMGPQMIMIIRKYRADIWGLPDQPEDWRS